MSGQVSRGSAGEYQADERAGFGRLTYRVVSDSVGPHRWQPTGLLCPWDSPGKNTGMSCHFLLPIRALLVKYTLSLAMYKFTTIHFLCVYHVIGSYNANEQDNE